MNHEEAEIINIRQIRLILSERTILFKA